jgi:hypothetical protein
MPNCGCVEYSLRDNRPDELRGEVCPMLIEAGPVAVAAIAAMSIERLKRPYPRGPVGTEEARCLEMKLHEPQGGLASWPGALSILCRLLCRQILPGAVFGGLIRTRRPLEWCSRGACPTAGHRWGGEGGINDTMGPGRPADLASSARSSILFIVCSHTAHLADVHAL